jgi:hypothetical protein
MNIQKIIHTLMISLLGIIPLQADVSESDAEINDNIERYQPAYHLNPESLAKMIEYKVAGFRYVYEIRLKNDVKVEPKPYWSWLPPRFLGYTEDDPELELVERMIS